MPRREASGVVDALTRCGAVLGDTWSVRVEELGAVMVDLVVGGGGEGEGEGEGDGQKGKGATTTLENAEIVRRGRELLGAKG